MSDKKNLSIAFKEEMKKKNITQAELSRILGQDRQTINKHLKKWADGGVPTISLLKKWCDAINCDYKKFLSYL